MKHFLIVGNKNALFWKDIFPLFMEGGIKYGYNHINCFILPDKNGVPRFGFFCKGKQVYTRILIKRV